jgi:NAD+ synthase
MDLTPKLRDHTEAIIIDFIRSKVEEANVRGVVLGLSGGVDSATVAKLCALALGPKKVFCLLMPVRENDMETKDANGFAKSLRVNCRLLNIQSIIESISTMLGIASISVPKSELQNDHVVLGNIMARVRMILLYAFANKNNCLVMGTSNKSELLVGYFTKFGDGGADFAPLGDLYKTQVYSLAKKLGIPKKICRKVPIAGLWPGQTDESELGISYSELDRILYGIELGYSDETISEDTGIASSKIKRVHSLINSSVHKRKLALIPKLGVRTIGIDWRE